MNLYDIKNPEFIQDLDDDQLNALASDIRNFLYESISKTGGHLSSNLGVVELSIALHYVFNNPNDKFIFDVGHQSYVHKILTGRAKDFKSLRQFKGLSGFQKLSEGDDWEAGHSSTSISAALGMAVSRDLNKEDHEVIAVIGDGSITNGMSFEALNHLGDTNKKVIIVFNDNNMSISKNVGGVNKSFNKLRVSKPYTSVKRDISSTLSRNNFGNVVLDSLSSVKNVIKKNVIEDSLFTNFGIEYIGPIDGHNFKDLIKAFKYAKEQDDPIILHVVTTKGKGIKACEEDTLGDWHGVGQYDVKTGKQLTSLDEHNITYSEVISNTLIRLAEEDEDIVAISPAMLAGSKLLDFQKLYPNRTFDPGIAESHATTFAAGLAIANKKPFLVLYSTFLQRSYDQINHDIARMNLPVVIGVDRAGIVGEDGDTHQGVFDISILNSIPNMVIVQGKDMEETQNLLYSAFKYQKPVAIRYPRGSTYYKENDQFEYIDLGLWTKEIYNDNIDAVLIAYGTCIDSFKRKIESNNLNIALINARFIKPLDTTLLDEIAKLNVPVFTYENEMLNGGLSSMINDYYNDKNIQVKLTRFGIDDQFVEHGSVLSLRRHLNLNSNYVLNAIKEDIERK